MHIFVTANYRDAFVFFAFFLGGSKFENRKTTIYYDGSMIFWIFAEQIIVTVSWFSGCSMQQIIVTFFYNILFFSSCFSFFSFSFSFSLFLSIRHFVPYWITSLRSWFQTKSASLRRFAAYLSTLLRSWFHKKCLLPKGIYFFFFPE